ncbi:MAG TPA: serine hydrolase domain-containing protein [Longimicrobiales bacterium]
MRRAPALGLGAIDTSTPVYAAFGGEVYFAHPDPRKASLTLAHLLTHSSGLACDDNDDASPGNEDAMQSQTAQPDWFRYILDLPLVKAPGEQYAYCSGGMNLAGGVLAAGQRRLAARALRHPGGAAAAAWTVLREPDADRAGVQRRRHAAPAARPPEVRRAVSARR